MNASESPEIRPWLPLAWAAVGAACAALVLLAARGAEPGRDILVAAAVAGAIGLLVEFLRTQRGSDGQPSAPRFRRPDGSPLPRRLRVLPVLFKHAPAPVARALRRWLEPRVLGALPEMLVEMPDGRRLHIHAGDRPYGRVLLVGEYEPDTSAALRQFATTGAFAIDVGANQGWLSVLIGRAVGADGQVWAFEPTPPIVPALHDNLRRNPDVRARVFETALGDEQGELTINVFAGLPSAHASASTLGRSDATSYTVPVTTLDALRSEMPALPSLIKIDVEGAELAVLRGAQGVLEQAAEAVIVLEVNHETSAAFGYRPADILAELERHRPYRIFRAGQFGLEPEPDPDQAPHGATWVCVPPGVAAEPRGVS